MVIFQNQIVFLSLKTFVLVLWHSSLCLFHGWRLYSRGRENSGQMLIVFFILLCVFGASSGCHGMVCDT